MRKLIIVNMEKFISSEYWIGVTTTCLGWGLSFVSPLWPFIFLTLALTLTDLYSGVRAAKKRGEEIRSHGFRRTVEKIVLYTSAILLCEGMKAVFFPSINVTYIAAFTICLTELKSNMENIYTVTGVDVWSQLVDVIKKKKLP
jgi:hypothetical protein